ncbi:hypothetical protein ZIOFF_043341 [Zingiber officinale]|uniref:Gag-pol polyprotein n=1 Tax=Zingiber officinale TaxID=94328 RepID=A0A8J5FWD6_ZINOF|nr:hypothetical protein ZIOFF_043341 [Zingiber officinale]
MSMGNPIMSLLANNTLTGENFPKWKSNINIVLVSENNRFVLTEECPPVPPANATRAVRELYDRWIASNNKAKAYMLASMSDALRSKMEPKECAFEIMESLQEMFGQQSEQARHEATRKYTNARMILGTHVRDHVMQMTNYFSEAEMHGAVIDEGTQVSIILNSLSSDFIPFTSNYIMNKLNYGMTQLLNELQTFEAILGLVKNKAEANIVNKPNSSKGLKRKMAKGGKSGDLSVMAHVKCLVNATGHNDAVAQSELLVLPPCGTNYDIILNALPLRVPYPLDCFINLGNYISLITVFAQKEAELTEMTQDRDLQITLCWDTEAFLSSTKSRVRAEVALKWKAYSDLEH